MIILTVLDAESSCLRPGDGIKAATRCAAKGLGPTSKGTLLIIALVFGMRWSPSVQDVTTDRRDLESYRRRRWGCAHRDDEGYLAVARDRIGTRAGARLLSAGGVVTLPVITAWPEYRAVMARAPNNEDLDHCHACLRKVGGPSVQPGRNLFRGYAGAEADTHAAHEGPGADSYQRYR
jgi:hypothetical protein